MDEAKYKDHPILLDHVVHDPIFTYPQSVERVTRPLDRLDRFARDASRSGTICSKLLEGSGYPLLEIGRELLEGTDRAGRKFDLVGTQRTSFRPVVRPLA